MFAQKLPMVILTCMLILSTSAFAAGSCYGSSKDAAKQKVCKQQTTESSCVSKTALDQTAEESFEQKDTRHRYCKQKSEVLE
jgi:hypothetical protein